MPIDTVQDLREHLELAIKVELSTIPPYLYAMYSIVDQESEAALLIRSIAAEEMLHAALVTNILLAMGGESPFAGTDIIPQYPGDLPHYRPPLRLGLAPCSLDLVRDVFMVIEQPEPPGAAPEADEFETLGQFYEAVEQSIHRLGAETDLFGNPQAERQMADPSFYTPVAYDDEDSGGLGLVDSVEAACEAIEIIVHQGEGLTDEKWADPAHRELTHYHKLVQIAEGASPLGAVRPAVSDPAAASFPPHLRPVSDLFNASYRRVFLAMDTIFGPSPDKQASVGELYRLMASVMSPVGHYLMTQDAGGGLVAGPTFEIYEFGDADPDSRLAELAADVAAEHPALGAVAAALAV